MFFLVGLILRISGGEPLLYFPSLIHYPLYDNKTKMQYFPFKTFSMLCSLLSCIYGSLLAEYLFKNGHLKSEWDILNCVINIDSTQIVLPTDTSFNVSCNTLAMQQFQSTNDENNDNNIDNQAAAIKCDKNLLTNKLLNINESVKYNQILSKKNPSLYLNAQQYSNYSTISTITS